MLPVALAGKIIEIIFETAIATGATQVTEGAIEKGKELFEKIKGHLPQLQTALQQAEEQQSREILLEAEVVTPLAEELEGNLKFAEDLKAIVQQILERDRTFAEELEAIVQQLDALKTQTQIETQNNKDVEKVVNIQNAENVNF